MPALTWFALTTTLAFAPQDPEPTPRPEPTAAERPSRSAALRGALLIEDPALDLGDVLIELSCSCEDQVQRLRPALGGTFSYAGLTPGRYTVRARYPGGHVELPLVLEPGRESTVALRIHAAAPPAPSVADDNAAPTPPLRPAGAVATHPRDSGAGLRRYGLGFTVLGTVLGIGGLVAAYHNPCGKDGSKGGNCEVDVRNIVALGLGVTALGSMTGGLISMAVGQALRKRDLDEGRITVQLSPKGAGLRLRF